MESIAPSSTMESYLRRIMNLIGKIVEVQVKDGSLFAGIFFTSSVKGQGIVLKEAELIVLKEAELTEWSGCKSNVASGVIVETLVIPSEHIVQVVSKGEGIILSVNDVTANISGDSIEALVIVPSSVKDKNPNSKRRQAEQSTMPCSQNLSQQVTQVGEGNAEITFKPFHSGVSVTNPQHLEGLSSADSSPGVAGSSVLTSSASVTATASEMVQPKDCKFYPKANPLSPSPPYASPISAGRPAVPTAVNSNIGNMEYIQGRGQPVRPVNQHRPAQAAPSVFNQNTQAMAYIQGRGQPVRHANPAQAVPRAFNQNTQADINAPQMWQLALWQPGYIDDGQGQLVPVLLGPLPPGRPQMFPPLTSQMLYRRPPQYHPRPGPGPDGHFGPNPP